MTGARARPASVSCHSGRRGFAAALDHADPLQFLEPLGQERLRHQRNAAADIAEMRAAGEHFGNYQRRPSLGDDLGRLGDRAKLAIAHHGRSPPKPQLSSRRRGVLQILD